MSDYRLFGAETSPYSMKVRAFLKYKGVDFEWVGRSSEKEQEFQSQAKVPTIPLLTSPGRAPNQDSTDILSAIENDHAEPSCVPDDAACAVLALILEDYGDEWLNKIMFRERWGQKADRDAAAERAMEQLFDGNLPRAKKKTRDQIAKRMRERLPLIGIERKNEKALKDSFERFIPLLNTHLENNLFIFGNRPSVADFSIAAQLSQMLMDPTPGAWLREHAPFVTAWCEFMDAPKAGDGFKSLEELKPTLLPIFSEELSKTYLPWAKATLEADIAKEDRVSVKLDRKAFEQVTQRYTATSFKSVQKAVRRLSDNEALTDFLKTAGADVYFQNPNK
ncbi:MAG: glutathione S-transferase [Henriciella sp.]|jgi:glutathione S-transferase|uniref:glutathione S-transferase family protein n=1 Tax=Henriciella sp. TaxID=1968823 RepID=UPI000C11E283|nr:glutathione S-transferase family protein [Henriciella sp.]MAN74966.1 glutathione S-transferase [Henriciella sp.]MBF33837.1 glutathione S-transferase [Hyphomonadaceae bacterium]MBK74403.1 glutathione S-transferase [Henriciella sp.]PHR74839.1 MAG: glutathione S-transferase [Henriciella sp.]|tara:strand:- start:22654 stop:23658 length:1005 start_codon:yes stop_codon:yes gene_type:complete